jgi:AraC-like DNA-binding protein
MSSLSAVDLPNLTDRLRPDTTKLAPANSPEDACLMPISTARPPLMAGSVSLDGMHVDLQWHFHDMHKLLYAFEGAIEVESSHGRHLVPRQLAAWIPAGAPHCTSIHGIRWVSVFFPTKMLNDPERRVRTLMVSGLMREMLREAMRWPVASAQNSVRKIFFEAMAALCGEWITREANLFLPTSKDPRMKRALDYTNLRMDSSLCDVCRQAGMSVRSLRRHLKAEIGMTWEEYRHRSQLLQSISLLSETDQPISEIAAQCGFESPSGFAKAFRLEMGEAPRDYRHRVRGPSRD